LSHRDKMLTFARQKPERFSNLSAFAIIRIFLK
jgi:hypothetical protein